MSRHNNSEEDGQGEELGHSILLEEPGVVTRKTSIVEHAKLQMKKFLLSHLGERFGRKDLIEALEAVMPLPRQRNLNEALAELGKDATVKVVFEGREKFYCWQDGFSGCGEKLEAVWALDPDADAITQGKTSQ